MPRGLVILGMVALLLAAGGLMLWQWALARQSRKAAARHLEQQMKERIGREQAAFDVRRTRAGATGTAGGVGTGAGMGTGSTLNGDPWAASSATQSTAVAAKRGLAAIPLPAWLEGVVSIRILALCTALSLGLALLALRLAGGVAAIAAIVLLAGLGAFAIWTRKQKLRKQLVRQLPGFIDSMVRLITIGNSIHAAFTLSAASAKSPLREHMESASGLVRAGVDLDQALSQMARNVDIEEMYLLASILGLGVRYGGRADVLLERVAGFMRDREQAEQELVAMSAETRLSAWVLGLLPIVVGGVIVMLNPGHFVRMLNDTTGLTMIWSALGLQASGVFFLYRLARLA